MVDVRGDVLRSPHGTTPAAVKSNKKSEMRSFKSNENIHKKEGGSYYVVSANKASSVVRNVQKVFTLFRKQAKGQSNKTSLGNSKTRDHKLSVY